MSCKLQHRYMLHQIVSERVAVEDEQASPLQKDCCYRSTIIYWGSSLNNRHCKVAMLS